MDEIYKKDLYKILNIKPNATNDEIKSAYRKMAKEFHPDLYANNPLIKLAEEKLKEINEAYEVLSDETKKKQYDKQRLNPQANNESYYEQEETNKAQQNTNQNNQEYNNNNNNNYNNNYNNNNNNNYNNNNNNNYNIGCCHIHKNKVGINKCSVCEAILCEECVNAFDVLMCPTCLKKNNELYLKGLKLPLTMTLFVFILALITGVVLGYKYDILEDKGIIEGLSLSVYSTCFYLYYFYIGPTISKAIYKILEFISSFIDISEEAANIIINILNVIIGITIGWIFGFIFGIIRLKKDYKMYVDSKIRNKETEKYIKEKFNI